ncbi:yrdC domain-containing protein, mitochondrial [Protopterus annectens]|uniref:yrdC domain-containing protein, mitochondrial n=1 Tax=Protopterus annectens TaxID=7888 RepID=UPI001CF9EDD2|nr:yrdC domain-containing protein, mitochondrial [Protopterus annectens]
MVFLVRCTHVVAGILHLRSPSLIISAMCIEMKSRVVRLPGVSSRNGLAVENRHNTGEWREIVSSAVTVLKQGGVIAVPTDTIYGIAGLAQNSEAIERIYELKGRNGNKPLAICVGSIKQIYRFCKVTVPDHLLQDLLPGPVTLVFERLEALNKNLNPFTHLVGVRIPDHAFMQELARACEEPLALTSANISSQISTLKTEEFQDLWSRLGLVIDGGPIGDVMSPVCRLGSTVVNLSTPGKYNIIRQGCALSHTEEVLQKYGLRSES